jgi:hypothetical protein
LLLPGVPIDPTQEHDEALLSQQRLHNTLTQQLMMMCQLQLQQQQRRLKKSLMQQMVRKS